MTDKKTHYMNGLKLFGASKNEEAIEAFNKALEEDPEWSDCLQALSMALMNAGRLDEALEKSLKNTELAPNDPLAFTSLSMIYQRLERIDLRHASLGAKVLELPAVRNKSVTC